ncbi:MAG: YaaL family protein [Lachnospiraceae bacterium]|nr:YaaL family protein [Lachnospiraceae bacterium]
MSIFRKKKPEKNDTLLLELAKTKIELETAYSNFENVTDPDLIDSSIYEVNAVLQRYKYLMRQLKLDETDAAAAAQL